ncbi:MAG: hypothetical protein AUJ20_10565 [Comamonadaceae bacterium CG1_02_60_18]|nr:MAG: hypothetical protein AUJ20_10565 [Comamonadaceae bacterium CG1_02_60_18]PIQ51812.1 MAG: hypothetical protein COW02_12875 [Comamonadaceae bacterium CG12_big_fil_rev_8_21_14_0_65_59_15]
MRKVGESGFTLIELLVTLAIVVVLVALAAPSFQQLLASTSMTSQANEFLAALNYTRSEAVKRNTQVAMCKSSTGTACVTAGGWQQGWIIFMDPTNSGSLQVVDNATDILRVHAALSGGSTLVGQIGVADYVAYLPNGQSSQSGRWDLCSVAAVVAGRDVTLSAGSGRASVAKDGPPAAHCNGE